MAGSRTARGAWRAIRTPGVTASAPWRRQRMWRLSASAQRGWPPAARRRAADPGSAPPPTVAGVHRRQSEARRRAVDEPLVARVVAPAVGAGPARPSPYDPAAAEHTQPGPTPGAEAKDEGPPSRPPRAMRHHHAPAARVRGGGRCSAVDRHEKDGMAGACAPCRHALHRRNRGNLRPRVRRRERGDADAPRGL
jgi:hypothetical protein